MRGGGGGGGGGGGFGGGAGGGDRVCQLLHKFILFQDCTLVGLIFYIGEESVKSISTLGSACFSLGYMCVFLKI